MKTSKHTIATLIGLLAFSPSSHSEPLTSDSLRDQRDKAVSLPSGFDWPADPTFLWKISGGVNRPNLKIPGKVDIKEQRKHGWNLFAGVTSPSDPGNLNGIPVFMTWYTGDETFAKPEHDFRSRENFMAIEPSTQFLLSSDNPVKSFLINEGISVPERFDPDFTEIEKDGDAEMFDAHRFEGVVFSHVAFNQELHDFIRAKGYYRKSVLRSVADKDKVRLPIDTPPTRSASLKMGWWPIAKSGVTPLPVWDFDPRFPGDATNPPMTWKRVVAVDPSGTSGPVSSLKLGDYTHKDPRVVSIDKFFAVELDAADVAAAESNWRVKKAAQDVLGRRLKPGDYLVLTAIHINTREFEPWVFTSFWWHDKPNDGRWAEDRTANVKGLWRNYLMGVSYNINKPAEPDGSGKIVQNPYLELFQKGGVTSSCMSCHARSAYSPYFRVSPAFNPKSLGTTDPDGYAASPSFNDDEAFKKGTVFLDTIWTLHTRSIND